MERVIGCGEAVRRLWEFLDRELTPNDHRAVEEHLVFCRQCCGELEFARELRRVLQASAAADVPLEVRDRLGRFIDGLSDTTGEKERGTP